MRILVVEDDIGLAEVIVRRLRDERMAVDVVHDGQAAVERAGVTGYDAVVLDRDLPHLHGDEVCRRLVALAEPPRILMLTAASAVASRVEGLNLGADDYLVKPFALAELVARLRALDRRDRRLSGPLLRWRDLEVDLARHRCVRAGHEVRLSRREYGLLVALLRADGATVTTEELMRRVWDENLDPFSSVVRVTVHALRGKLRDPPVVETVPGYGYRMA